MSKGVKQPFRKRLDQNQTLIACKFTLTAYKFTPKQHLLGKGVAKI